MSQINKKIAKVARKTDRKIDRSPSKTDHFILLTLALFLVVIVMTLLSPSYAQTATDETIASLTSRLTSLENLQSAMVSTSRGAFEQMNYIFTIVAAFFGLFALFFAYRQLRADSNREERDQEMRSLVASFQQNITTISSLIGTLEQTFKYREQIEEKLTLITQRAANLELQNQESYALFKSNVDDLNSEAVKLFDSTLDRNKLSFEENIKRLDLFRVYRKINFTIRESYLI